MELYQQYIERSQKFEQAARQFERRYNRIALLRLALFFIAVAIFVFLTTVGIWWASAFALLFVILFVRFVKWHQNIQHQQRFHKSLATINLGEAAVIKGDYSRFDSGEQFLDAAHSYAIDLDIFGPHSFYQYCNRTTTAIGSVRLANYLTKLPNIDQIGKRQQAILELKNQLDWRQHFWALGLDAKDDIRHTQALQQWLGEPDFILSSPKLRMALWLNPLWVALGAFLWIFYIPWQLAILFLVFPVLILRNTYERVNKAHIQTTHAEKILTHYARLINHIEESTFDAELLIELRLAFVDNNIRASANIRQLSYIISQLNVRYNAFAFLLNAIGLWDLQWVLRLEKWKLANKEQLPIWFDTLSELEALNSLATAWYNNPGWQMPKIWDNPVLEAYEMGHPLIHPSNRVCNDFQSSTKGHIKLVTGSNMAGKSTFLRTVGLNIVLAMSGSAVCASSLKLPMLAVFTSMRTQDALHESTSSFYAELKRLKVIIEAVEALPNAFFLLDEILKGTNSNDRHTGSKALIRQLIKSGGAGIIATHDLELGAMADSAEGAIENLCMEVDIRDGELFFNYKLQPGISKSFNATLLMKEMGIKIEQA